MYDEHNIMDMLLLNFDENMLSDEFSISSDGGFKHSHESGISCARKSNKTVKSKRSKHVAKFPLQDEYKVDHLNVVLFGTKLPKRKSPSRIRHKKPVLYAFPSYDKCDSLIYFPTAFTRHMNSTDFDSLSKLIRSHMDKNCSIKFDAFSYAPSFETLVSMFSFMIELHPDSLCCARETTVTANQINATIFIKFTEVKSITNALLRTAENDPMRRSLLAENALQFCDDEDAPKFEKLSVEERARMREIMNDNSDVVVHIRLAMQLTLDDASRKIVRMHMKPSLISLTPLGYCYI